MAKHINPRGMPKELWLKENGEGIREDQFLSSTFNPAKFVAVLIDNGAFTAAAVLNTPEEHEYFKRPDDRPKQYYLVDPEKVKEVWT